MGFIYALSESLDGETFYIGQTKNVQQRFRQHQILKGTPGNTMLLDWILYCFRVGKGDVQIRILEECPDEILTEREMGWIRFALSQGWNLTNKCGGFERKEEMYMNNYAHSKIHGRKFVNQRYYFFKR